MRLRSGRLVIAGFAAAASAVLFAAPASAATPTLQLKLGNVIVATANTASFTPRVLSDQDTTVAGFEITYQLSSGLTGVTLTDPPIGKDCTDDDPAKITCDSPFSSEITTDGINDDLALTVAADGTATVGETGTITVTFTGKGLAPVTQSATVDVAESVDLAAGADLTATAKPGEAADAKLSVHVNGSNTVHGAAIQIDADYTFKATEQYSNCDYVDDRAFLCTFDQDLTAGQTYQVTLPYEIRPDAAAPQTAEAFFDWMPLSEEQDQYTGPTGTPGTGGALTLTQAAAPAVKSLAKQTDTDLDNNSQSLSVTVTGKQGVDIAAVGTTLSGQAGDTVSATVGLHNNGPATLDFSRSGEPASVVIVTPPAGTTVTTIPAGCRTATDNSDKTKPGVLQYVCLTATIIPAGTTDTWTFGLLIGSSATGAAGDVEVNPACACDRFSADLDKSNNAAPITLTLAGGGSSPSPSASVSATPSASASAVSGGGASATATVSMTPVAANGTGGGVLATTGAESALVGGIGVLLIAGGAVGFVLTRRRRTRFQA